MSLSNEVSCLACNTAVTVNAISEPSLDRTKMNVTKPNIKFQA